MSYLTTFHKDDEVIYEGGSGENHVIAKASVNKEPIPSATGIYVQIEQIVEGSPSDVSQGDVILAGELEVKRR